MTALPHGTYTDNIDKIVQVGSNCCVGMAGTCGLAGPDLIEQAANRIGAKESRPTDAIALAGFLSEYTQRQCGNYLGSGGTNIDVNFVVAGYKVDAEGKAGEAVLRVLLANTAWTPMAEDKGWFLCAGRGDLVPHYRDLIGKDLDELSMAELGPIGVFILLRTAKFCASVSGPFDMFHVHSDLCVPVETARLVKWAEKIGPKIGRTLLRDAIRLQGP
jgi:hypothetical protein